MSAIPANASAFCWASAPAMVTGAIAPARVKGVMMMTWPRALISMMPVSIGASSRSGEDELITEISEGSDVEPFIGYPPCDARDLQRIAIALTPQRIGVKGLVSELCDV